MFHVLVVPPVPSWKLRSVQPSLVSTYTGKRDLNFSMVPFHISPELFAN